jgi:hypothetical protein
MIEIESRSVAGCPHVDAAGLLLEACVEELQVKAHIEEKVGAYSSLRSALTAWTSWDRHTLPTLHAASTLQPVNGFWPP